MQDQKSSLAMGQKLSVFIGANRYVLHVNVLRHSQIQLEVHKMWVTSSLCRFVDIRKVLSNQITLSNTGNALYVNAINLEILNGRIYTLTTK